MKELKEVIVDITEILDCAEMYAKEAVKSLAGAKIISGMEDGSFAPMESATRAQTAKMVYELMKIINAEV